MDRKDFIENIVGGIFAIIAILAAIAEVIINGVSAATIAAGIKDVFGTLVVIILFFVVIKDSLPKIYTNYKKAFDDVMEELIKKYDPLLTKDESNDFRYNINSNLLSICGEKSGTPRTFFDYTEDTLTFSVRKEIFMKKGEESFDEMQKKIVSQIELKLKDNFNYIEDFKPIKDGFTVKIKKQNKILYQAKTMKNVVDNVLILFIAENKKQ